VNDQMLQQKFEDQCTAVPRYRVKSASSAIRNIEDVKNIADIESIF
jgi:aconitate decarboxylase